MNRQQATTLLMGEALKIVGYPIGENFANYIMMDFIKWTDEAAPPPLIEGADDEDFLRNEIYRFFNMEMDEIDPATLIMGALDALNYELEQLPLNKIGPEELPYIEKELNRVAAILEQLKSRRG